MLTGLARDGGLYVPEVWPQLSHETIAGFFGRPYWEVAVDVIKPFAARRNLRRRSRPHGERGLRDVPPSGGGAARPDRAQSIRAGAVPRPDAGVQGRRDAVDLAADGSRAGQARAAHHHRGRDLGRYRRRRGRCVRRPRQCRSDRAVPARPHLRRAAADDDDDGRGQRACARDRGHVRRLPGDREGDVQPSRLSRRGLAVRRQLDQLGADRGAGGLLFHLGGRARRARAHGGFHRADRQFRRHLCRLRRQEDGPADPLAAHRRQRQRHPAAHAEDRHL